MDKHKKRRIGRQGVGRWLAWLVLTSAAMALVMTIGARTSFGPAIAEAQLPGWSTKTFVFHTVTDGDGRFTVPHGLAQGCSGDRIDGMTVALRSRSNGRFYGGTPGAGVHVRYSWSDTEISGSVESDPRFAGVPVRIVAFTTRRIC